MNIEFVDPVLPSRRAWTGVLAFAALAAVLFAAGRILQTRAASLQQEARARAAALNVVQPSMPPVSPPPYGDDLQRALDRASLPEAPVLRELETVAVVGIQLTSIDVSMADHIATVELQADNDAALGDFLDQLNAGLAAPAWRIDRLAAVQANQAGGSGSAGSAAQSVTLKRRF